MIIQDIGSYSKRNTDDSSEQLLMIGTENSIFF